MYYPHLIDKETEVQEGKTALPDQIGNDLNPVTLLIHGSLPCETALYYRFYLSTVKTLPDTVYQLYPKLRVGCVGNDV